MAFYDVICTLCAVLCNPSGFVPNIGIAQELFTLAYQLHT